MTQPPHIAALWEDLKQLLIKVVAEMNRLEEFSKRTGGLDCNFSEADVVVVTKRSPPAMTLTVTRRADGIDLFSRITTEGAAPVQRDTHETLAAEIDEGGASLRTEDGEVLTVDDAVYYILRPFLHLGSAAN